MCLLLTLLAVPVFYSLFDDLARSHIWSRIGSNLGGIFRARASSRGGGSGFFVGFDIETIEMVNLEFSIVRKTRDKELDCTWIGNYDGKSHD